MPVFDGVRKKEMELSPTKTIKIEIDQVGNFDYKKKEFEHFNLVDLKELLSIEINMFKAALLDSKER